MGVIMNVIRIKEIQEKFTISVETDEGRLAEVELSAQEIDRFFDRFSQIYLREIDSLEFVVGD